MMSILGLIPKLLVPYRATIMGILSLFPKLPALYRVTAMSGER
jgi:hypothetical protein